MPSSSRGCWLGTFVRHYEQLKADIVAALALGRTRKAHSRLPKGRSEASPEVVEAVSHRASYDATDG